MQKNTQTMTREQAVAALDIHYAPTLDHLDTSHLLAPRPQTTTAKLMRLARFDASTVIGITEELGAARESYQFKTIEEAQEKLSASRREHYQQHRSAITTLLMDEATQAALTQEEAAGKDAPKPVTTAAAKAAATVKAIDAALHAGFSFQLRTLKDSLTLPAQILNVGQTVYVLRDTDSAPKLKQEQVFARDVVPAFFGGLSAQFSYAVTTDGKAPAATAQDDARIFAAAGRDNERPGLVAAGKNMLVFNNVAAARAALRDIVSEKLDAADAARDKLTESLREQGLKRKPKGPAAK